jgi:hypothetical protein
MAWKHFFILFMVTVEECWMACPIVVGGGSFSQARIMLVSLAVVSVVRRVRAVEIDRSIWLSLKHLMKMAWGLTKQAIKI